MKRFNEPSGVIPRVFLYALHQETADIQELNGY